MTPHYEPHDAPPPSVPGLAGVLLLVIAVVLTLYQTALYSFNAAGLVGITVWAFLAGVSLFIIGVMLDST